MKFTLLWPDPPKSLNMSAGGCFRACPSFWQSLSSISFCSIWQRVMPLMCLRVKPARQHPNTWRNCGPNLASINRFLCNCLSIWKTYLPSILVILSAMICLSAIWSLTGFLQQDCWWPAPSCWRSALVSCWACLRQCGWTPGKTLSLQSLRWSHMPHLCFGSVWWWLLCSR